MKKKLLFMMNAVAVFFLLLLSTGAFGQVRPGSPKTYHTKPNMPMPHQINHHSGDAPVSAPCNITGLVDYNAYNEVWAGQNGMNYTGSWYAATLMPQAQEIAPFVDPAHEFLTYTYALAAFDSITFTDMTNLTYTSVPLASSTISLDSMGMFIGIFGDTLSADGTMANDSLVFSIYPIVNGLTALTPVKTIVFAGYAQLSPFFVGIDYLTYAQININQVFNQGEGFAIRMDYLAKDTSSHCLLSYSYADSCGTVLYMGNPIPSPAYPSPFAFSAAYGPGPLPGNSFWGLPVPIVEGVSDSVQDQCNIFAYNQGWAPNCSFVYTQNWEMLPFITVLGTVSADVSGTTTSCSGSVTATVTSGAEPISYLWNTGDTTSTVSGLSTGTYTVTITTATGCSLTASADVITTNVDISVNATATTCGANNGTATVTVNSGTAPFTYLWDDAETTASIINLAAGTYGVTVTDFTGCSATGTTTVDASTGVTVLMSEVDASCLTPGSATATVTTGTAPYVYAWSNGGNTDVITNLSGGDYTVTVTDATSCTATGSVTVGSTGLTLNITTTPDTCVAINGTATAVVSGGSGTYTYIWNPGGGTTATIVALNVGSYDVTVSDGTCSATATGVVGSASTVVAAIDPTAVTICPGSSTTLTASGGPFFEWSTTDVSTSIDVSPASTTTYSVTVGDLNGCTASASSVVTVATPPTADITPASATICSGGSGAVFIATGAANYLWSTGETTSQIFPNPTTTTTYSVTVTDGNGCTGTASATVTVNPAPTASIDPISAAVCAGGSVDLTASGGNTYLWNDGTSTALNTVSPSGTTTYNVTVTDNNNCTGSAATTVTVNPAPSASISPANPSICSNQSVTLTASGGTSYLWSTTETTAVISVTPTATTTYSVTVTDANTCTATADATVTLTIPTPATWTGGNDTVPASGTVTLTGGSPAGGTYSGPNVSAGVFDAGTAGPGTYTIYYIADNGCGVTDSASKTFVVIVSGINEISLENSISLFPNPTNDVVTVQADVFNNAKVTPVVYDVTGQIVTAPYQIQANRIVFSTSELAAGMYWIKFNINGQQASKRFVKMN